jgi:hypothetical protein
MTRDNRVRRKATGAASLGGLLFLLAALCTPATADAASAPTLPFDATGMLGVLDTAGSASVHHVVFDTSTGIYSMDGTVRNDVARRRHVELAQAAKAVWAFDFEAIRLGPSTDVAVRGANPLIVLAKRDASIATPLVLDGARGADGGRGAGGGGGGGGGAVAILANGPLTMTSLISVNGGPGGVGNAAWTPIHGGDGGAGSVTLASAKQVRFTGTVHALSGGKRSGAPGGMLLAGPMSAGAAGTFNGVAATAAPTVRVFSSIAPGSFTMSGGSGGGGGGGTGLPEAPTPDYVKAYSPGGMSGAGGGLGGDGAYAVAGGAGGRGGAAGGPNAGGGGGGGGGAYRGFAGGGGAGTGAGSAGAPGAPGGPGLCPIPATGGGGGPGGKGLTPGGDGGNGGKGGDAPGGGNGTPGGNGSAQGGGGGGGGGGGDGCGTTAPGSGGNGGNGATGTPNGSPGSPGQPGRSKPAVENGAAVLAFTGSATTSALSSPIVGAPVQGTWSFTGTGVGVTTAGPAIDDAASTNAAGSLGGGFLTPFGNGALCGLSGGSGGTGNVKVGFSLGLADVGWRQSAATIIFFEGLTTSAANGTGSVVGEIDGIVSAIPPIPGVIGAGSCTSGTATSFTIVGAGVGFF